MLCLWPILKNDVEWCCAGYRRRKMAGVGMYRSREYTGVEAERRQCELVKEYSANE